MYKVYGLLLLISTHIYASELTFNQQGMFYFDMSFDVYRPSQAKSNFGFRFDQKLTMPNTDLTLTQLMHTPAAFNISFNKDTIQTLELYGVDYLHQKYAHSGAADESVDMIEDTSENATLPPSETGEDTASTTEDMPENETPPLSEVTEEAIDASEDIPENETPPTEASEDPANTTAENTEPEDTETEATPSRTIEIPFGVVVGLIIAAVTLADAD